jgi:hypothetical protein
MPKHPKKDIEDAIQYALVLGWRYKQAGNSSHAWGRLLCCLADPRGCSISIWSSPRDPVNHAKQIKRKVMSCPHNNSGDKNES